jgi:ornithine cyclodeaminase/alanine dehydrogenase-like protein (mu-crystallin family)
MDRMPLSSRWLRLSKRDGGVVTLLLDERSVADLLTPADALAWVEEAFRLLGVGAAVNEPRHRSVAAGTTVNVMWALAPTLDAVAVKSYPVIRSDVSQATVILLTIFSHSTGECLGIMQGDLLGKRRTAAATALATRLAARPDSRTLAVFGTGYQASGQVQALVAVLPHLRDVMVVGRAPTRRDSFVARLSAKFPNLLFSTATAEDAVRAADVVVTATGATEPLFDGAWLRPGTHVNAIGSNQSGTREIDLTTLTRASSVIVDSRAVAAQEGGDFLVNGFNIAEAVELGEVLVGSAEGRRDIGDITVFDSHGLAIQDLVCGLHVLWAAERLGRGHRVDWLDAPLAPALEFVATNRDMVEPS